MSRKKLKEMLKREMDTRINSYSSKPSKSDDEKPLLNTTSKADLLGKPTKEEVKFDVPKSSKTTKQEDIEERKQEDDRKKEERKQEDERKDDRKQEDDRKLDKRYSFDSDYSDEDSYTSEEESEEEKKYSESEEDSEEDHYKNYKRQTKDEDNKKKKYKYEDEKRPVTRDSRDSRDTRDSRDSRDSRDARDSRDTRDSRNTRDSRDDRDYLDERKQNTKAPKESKNKKRDDSIERPREDTRGRSEDTREERRDDRQNVSSSNPFLDIPKKAFLQLIKSKDVSNISGDCVDELKEALNEFIVYMFEQFAEPERTVMAEAADVKTYMSFYLEDEDRELPQDLAMPTKEIEKGIMIICDRFKIKIRKDVVYLVHMFAECILLKVIKGAIMINDLGKAKRLSGKEIRTAYKIYMM